MEEDAIFLDALQLTSPEARAAFLEQACAGDETLRRGVEQLLDAHGRAAGFLLEAPSGVTKAPAAFDQRLCGGSPGTDRPLQVVTAAGRRRDGHGLPGPTGHAGQTPCGDQDRQGRHGYAAGHCPVRTGTSGTGPDGSPPYRQGTRRGDHIHGPAVLRHGVGQGHPDHPVLRPRTPHDEAAFGAIPAGLPGGAARASERNHPPRPQAVERAGGTL